MFSKKPDKPKKYSAPSSPAARSAYTFHRPSDVTSNYSTSDYASDQELEDTAAPYAKIRSPVHLNRNSKIASIVKRFEPNSPTHSDSSRQQIVNPSTSEVIDRTYSQTIMDIQAISSDLSSLMTNINYFSSDIPAVNDTSNPHKNLIVETLIEPQINEDYKYTPKVTTSISMEDKKQFDLTLDSSHSSEHGDDMLSLDDFLSNPSPPKLPHSRYPRYSQEDELDSDTNTEKGSTEVLMDEVNRAVTDLTSSTDMEMTMESTLNESDLQTEVTMDTSINPEIQAHKEDSINNQIQLDRPAYIDINYKLASMDNRMTHIKQNISTDSKDRSLHLPNLLPTQNSLIIPSVAPEKVNTESTDNIMTSTTEEIEIPVTNNAMRSLTENVPSNEESNTEKALLSLVEQNEIPVIQDFNADCGYTSEVIPTNAGITMSSSAEQIEIPITQDSNRHSAITSVKLIQNTEPIESPSLKHRHAFSLSSDDVTNASTHTEHPPLYRSVTLSDMPNSNTPQHNTDSDACSVHSTPAYVSRPHKYTGYSLPPGETRSVSERIRSLLCKEPIECPKVDKLSLARAAIERNRSEGKPANLSGRPVLLEIKEPEEFNVRSLRDRFELKLRQIEPSGVMLAPSQLPRPARKKSEDLGIKPTFAG